MLHVLIAGAGKSSAHLIRYMLTHARQKWKVVVMDADAEMVAEKLNGHPKGEAAIINITDEPARQQLVRNADIVLSLMPPHLHYLLAKDCLKFKKTLITSSYVSEEIKALDTAARKAGVMMMCEMGLDPGIDHMSANALIHGVHRIAGSIHSFRSYCGGLVAPECDDNPWHYKISWNPRNIVLAGKQGASWIENGKCCETGYKELYSTVRKVKINELGTWAYYPNRDSLKYLDLYHLPEIRTFMRATLRHPAFMKGWEIIVRAGLTNEDDVFDVNHCTYSEWLTKKAGLKNTNGLKESFSIKFAVEAKEMQQLEWLGLFDHRRITGSGRLSSADILQTLLEEKWKMGRLDKDMVVMQHNIEYERRKISVKLSSTMIVKGEDRMYSAMSKTVGLPMAILAKKILLNEINISALAGVHIPVMPEVYVPVLKELRKNGVEFVETVE